jgi:hypothetical protein
MQEMAKLRYEMERLKQENELEKLRAELEEYVVFLLQMDKEHTRTLSLHLRVDVGVER